MNAESSRLPVVALVGRPNVGKSTLFNQLTRSRDALVADQPGVTRDRHYGLCRRDELDCVVVDTGGIAEGEDGLAGLMTAQSLKAMEEADVVVLVLDARDGLTEGDRGILQQVRRRGRVPLLAVNKVDGLDEDTVLAEFSALGLPALTLSAAHGRGIPDLVEALVAQLPEPPEPEAEAEAEGDGPIRVAILGRPNAGKSTLVNRLLGEERLIASDVPGTTRDSISVELERDGRQYRLVDTAGVRRRARVADHVEKISVIKTLQALNACQVAVVLLDGQEGVTDQDSHLLGHVLDSGRAVVVAVNKWDGLSADQRQRIETELDRKLTYLRFARRVRISALHGSGIRELMQAVNEAHTSATAELSTAEITRALERAVEAHQPPLVQGRTAKLRYAHFGGRNPPTVVIHGNRLQTLPDSYKRYLENAFREHFRLVGTPLRLEFRGGDNPYKDKHNVLTERQVRKRQRLRRFVGRK